LKSSGNAATDSALHHFLWLADDRNSLSPFWAAVLGLGVNYSAYEAENYRAGIQSIPKGHHDAALSLGLTRTQTIRKIVLPQAVRLVFRP
jgi:polar amino acid transport system substrate-binding protein